MTFIAWWGAGLSTILALVKFWEMWQDRFQVEVGAIMTGSPEEGNTIFIRNMTGHPVILTYWELFYSGRWPFGKKKTEISSPGPEAHDLRINAHSSTRLLFYEADHFGWSKKALNGRKIYIQLYFAGRRPMLRKVFG